MLLLKSETAPPFVAISGRRSVIDANFEPEIELPDPFQVGFQTPFCFRVLWWAQLCIARHTCTPKSPSDSLSTQPEPGDA